MVAKLIGQYGFTLNERRNFLRAAGVVLLPFALIVLQKRDGVCPRLSVVFPHVLS